MDPNALSGILLNNYTEAKGRQKSFSDMLRERTAFVGGQEGKVYEQTMGSIQNGANGVPIDPVAALKDFTTYRNANFDTQNQLMQQEQGAAQQSTEALNALMTLLNSAATRNVQGEELDLKKREQARKEYESGYDPTGAGSTDRVDQYAKEVISGVRQLDKVPAGLQSKVTAKLNEQGYSPDPFANQKKLAQDAISQLEGLYGRGKAENVGTGNDLSLAGGGNILERILGMAGGATSGVFDPGKAQDNNIYNNALKNVVGVFSQAFGSGTPQEGEAKRLIDSAPQFGSSDAEAKAWFKNARQLLATPQMKIDAKNGKQEKAKVGRYTIEQVE